MIKRIALLSLFLILTGCIYVPLPFGEGNQLKLGLDGISFVDQDDKEYTVEQNENDDVIILDRMDKDGEKESITIGSNDDEIHIDMFGNDEDSAWHMGEKLELPYEVPENIPLSKDANIYQHMKNEEQTMINYMTEADINEVIQLYESYFRRHSFTDGPEVSEVDLGEGILKSFTAEKEGKTISVTIGSGDSNDGSHNVLISVVTNLTE